MNSGMDVNEISSGRKDSGVTPLHLAAAGGHIEVMDELLERGGNIDARTRIGCGCKLAKLRTKNYKYLSIPYLSKCSLSIPLSLSIP